MNLAIHVQWTHADTGGINFSIQFAGMICW